MDIDLTDPDHRGLRLETEEGTYERSSTRPVAHRRTDVEPKCKALQLPIDSTGPLMMWGKRPDFIVSEQVPFNAEPPGEALAGGTITALDTFYCRNHGSFPDIPPQQWRVTVGDIVDMPFTLTYEQLTTGSPRTPWWRPWSAPVTGALKC